MSADRDSLLREIVEDRVATAMARTDVALAAIRAEVERAVTKFPAFHSAHEGYAVALEEVDELWAEVKRSRPDHAAMQTEALQCAAMFVRFLTDVTMPKVEVAR